MHIFLAAVFSNNYMPGQNRFVKLTEHEQGLVTSLPHILESYHYVGKQKYVDEMRVNNAQIFLDSGAFSAFTLGVNISVSEYCEYIKRNTDIIRVEDNVVMASVLDGIGDPLQTWRNQLEMELRGAKPLPCFHAGEDERYLEWYVRKYEYITLGGMVGSSTKQLCIWLDRMWDRYLTDGSGNPRLKVHGFGITSIPIMERYPWYCFPEGTHEVLTRSGWKTYGDILINEEILCYSEGDAVWQRIEEIPTFQVEDAEILNIWNRNFSAHVTSNHKWNVKKRYSNTHKFRDTEDMILGPSTSDWLIPRTGKYNSEALYSDDLVELSAWFWTEGSIKQRPRYKNNSIAIYQSEKVNPEKVDRIRALLKRLNEAHCESKAKCGTIQFELYGKASLWLLSEFPEKHLTWNFIYSMSVPQLHLFIDVSIMADGTSGTLVKGKTFQLVQKSNNSMDKFQVVCLLAGIPCNLSSSEDYNSVTASNVQTVDPSTLIWNRTKFTGKLWCVKVPSGAFFTRSEGKIYVTGNSCDSSSWIQSAAFGTVVTPDYGTLNVSEKSPSRHDAGQHASTLTAIEQDHVMEYLERQGFTYERLSKVYESRAAYNLWAYGVINTMINAGHNNKFNERIQELF